MRTGLACPDLLLLERLALGRLTEPEAHGLEEHLAACPYCVRALDLAGAEDDLVRDLRVATGSDQDTPPPYAVALIPALKRLRPQDSTVSWAGQAAADWSPADTAEDRLAFLAPAQNAEELGRVGGFRVLGVLGKGGMGVVFRAEDSVLRRLVALKVINPALVFSDEVRIRFLREAQALAALEHDHIVTVYQVGEDNGVPFLAMPLLRGQTLQDRLDEAGGPLPVDDILRIGRETATGLAVAHARGLVHRDIKPGNVWIEANPAAGRERVKILDFGLVQALSAGSSTATEPGRVLGTPAYMSPEQANGLPVDSRTDLFSLGCVLYQMATGSPPFGGGDLFDLLVRVTRYEPPPLRSVNPAVPSALEQLVARLMRKQPEGRPPSAQAVVEALQAIEASRRPRLSRRGLLGGAVAVLAAAGLTGWGVSRWLAAVPGQVTFDYDEPDARLALRLGDQTERVLDVKHEATLTLPPGDYALRPVAPAGKRFLRPDRVLVKPSAKQTVAVRLVGEVAGHLEHEPPVVGLVVVARAGGTLVLSVGDHWFAAWDAARGVKPRMVPHPESRLRCLTVAPDGRAVVTGSGDVGRQPVQGIRFWDLETLKPRPGSLKCGSQVNALAYSPDGKWLISGENDGTLRRWDVAAGKLEAGPVKVHGGLGVFGVAVLPDGKHVLTAGGDGVVAEWDAASLKPLRMLGNHTQPTRALAVLPGGQQAVSAGLDAMVRVWDLASGGFKEWTTPAPVLALAVSADGLRLLTGDAAGVVRLWDLTACKEVIRFDGHAKGVTAAAFTPDGRRAVSGGFDGAVRLWELPK